jgi:uncharacterized protein with PQ loop repeat
MPVMRLNMDTIKILGLVAGALTTAAFLPQVLKTWKSRSAKDLSLGMFSLFCLGVAMWLAYGFRCSASGWLFGWSTAWYEKTFL